MRAPQLRAYFCAAVLLPAMAAPLACTKNRNTNVNLADGESGGAPVSGDVDSDRGGPKPPRATNIETIDVTGSIVGAGDMLDAAGQLLTMWQPPEPGAPPMNLRAFLEVGLVQEGFGPGFLESLDLDGIHAFEFQFPHEGQPGVSESDVDLRLVMTAHQPVRVIESLPAEMRPQSIGQNLWQIVQDDVTLLFRAQTDSVEIAMSMPDLDVASTLRGKVPVGASEPRIRMSASNLPKGEIDVSDMIPLPDELSGPLSSILNETTAIDFAADFGTDRDLYGRVGAVAPFSRLGLAPIGPATQAPSELAKALPGDAMFVWLMPWGDPALLHTVLDKQIPMDQIPAPFDSYADEILKGIHGMLGQIRGEVLVAIYLDDKSQMTIAFAAEVTDEKAAQASMREIWGAADKAFSDHIAVAGKSPEHAYTVDFKQGGVKAGKAKADLFTLTIPKDKQQDTDDAVWFVGSKPKIEVSTLVANGKIIVAMGAGQKAFMASVGKGTGEGLEAEGGLALARKVSGGCQYCVAIDPEELSQLALTVFSTDSDEPTEVHKAAKDALAKLAKLDLPGQVALSLRLDADRGVFGFGVPKSLLFAEPTKIKALVELMNSIDEAREAAWNKAAATTSPG